MSGVGCLLCRIEPFNNCMICIVIDTEPLISPGDHLVRQTIISRLVVKPAIFEAAKMKSFFWTNALHPHVDILPLKARIQTRPQFQEPRGRISCDLGISISI